MTEFTLGGYTFRQRYRTCKGTNATTKDGTRKKCETCDNGLGHGPYWYAYGDYGAPRYIGKELPAEVTNLLDKIDRQRDKLKQIRAVRLKRADDAHQAWLQATEEACAIESILHGGQPRAATLRALELEEFILTLPEPKRRPRR